MSQTSKITRQVSFPKLRLEVVSLSHDKNSRAGPGATFFNICVGIVGCVLFSVSKYQLSSCFLGCFHLKWLFTLVVLPPVIQAIALQSLKTTFLLLACDLAEFG